MFIIGSDRVTSSDGYLEPLGELHAVDADGATACRDRAAVYTFPARRWPGAGTDELNCAGCVAIVTERSAAPVASAYPSADEVADMTDDSLRLVSESPAS